MYYTRNSIGDDKLRRSQIIGPNIRVNSPLEVSVPGENAATHEVVFLHCLGYVLMKRTGVAGAGHAAVARHKEAKSL